MTCGRGAGQGRASLGVAVGRACAELICDTQRNASRGYSLMGRRGGPVGGFLVTRDTERHPPASQMKHSTQLEYFCLSECLRSVRPYSVCVFHVCVSVGLGVRAVGLCRALSATPCSVPRVKKVYTVPCSCFVFVFP